MGRVRAMLFAGATTLLSVPAASAADLPMMPPMRPAIVEFSGWYLRGDIGFSNQSVGNMHQHSQDAPGAVPLSFVSKSFDSAPFFGVGVGYQFNSWLRMDVTGEYRGRANLHAASQDSNGAYETYTGSKSEFTGLVNVYADLGTWWHVTPFVGAGVGASYNRIHDFYDTCASVNYGCQGQITGVADGTGTKWNLAWALYAGLGYQVTPGLTVELAYRYINLGDAQSGFFHNVAGVGPYSAPFEFKDITSHDVKLGVRWNLFEPEPPVYAPPLMRKG